MSLRKLLITNGKNRKMGINLLNVGSQFITGLYGIGQILGEELWLWR